MCQRIRCFSMFNNLRAIKYKIYNVTQVRQKYINSYNIYKVLVYVGAKKSNVRSAQ
jgi:hypothetical protein